ncbi:MAG: hypothetical protein ACK518_03720 [bacterium]|jgi:hypothetical protein
MELNITDQLISGIQLSTTEWNFNPEVLISEAAINTAIFGIYYNNDVLTINDNLLEGLFALSPSGLEAYVDENKILKLK